MMTHMFLVKNVLSYGPVDTTIQAFVVTKGKLFIGTRRGAPAADEQTVPRVRDQRPVNLEL